MNKIKNFYKTKKSHNPDPHEPLLKLKTFPEDINTEREITEKNCESISEYSHNRKAKGQTLLGVGDILINRRNPKNTCIISKVPKTPVLVSYAWIVLTEIPEKKDLLPKWAVVHTIRLHQNLWMQDRFLGADTPSILNYTFEETPKPNPNGVKILQNIEELILHKREQEKLILKLHRAITQRLINNQSLKNELKNLIIS